MFEVKVTVNLAPELLALLQFFSNSQAKTIDKLTEIKDAVDPPADQAIASTKRTRKPTPVIPITPLPEGMTDVTGHQVRIDEMMVEAKKPDSETPITFIQLRAAAAETGRANEKARLGVFALFPQFGVTGLSALKSEQYPAFLTALKAL